MHGCFSFRFNKPEILYNCDTLAKPILHDTILQLTIDREIMPCLCDKAESEPNLLFDRDDNYSKQNGEIFEGGNENIQVCTCLLRQLFLFRYLRIYYFFLLVFQWNSLYI